jgi:Family of unknown function (DUF6627)
MHSSHHFKTISRILIFAMLHLCWLTSYGYAEMVPTESSIEQPSTSSTDRQRLLDLLNRQDVVDELEKYGISKLEATARINSLTEEEVTKIAGKLNELSEGGENMGGPMIGAGIAVLIILPAILLVTFYIAFLPIAAGVCVFVEDTWSECIEDYWGFFTKPLEGMYGPLPNEEEESECTKKCGDQKTKCFGSEEYEYEIDDLKLEIRHQCNLDHDDCLKNCQIEVKEKEEVKEETTSEKVEMESDSIPVEEDCDPGMESCD